MKKISMTVDMDALTIQDHDNGHVWYADALLAEDVLFRDALSGENTILTKAEIRKHGKNYHKMLDMFRKMRARWEGRDFLDLDTGEFLSWEELRWYDGDEIAEIEWM